MAFRDIFMNRYAELRVGWRFISFLVVVAIGFLVLGIPLRMLGARGEFIGSLVGLAASLGASYVMVRYVNKKPFGAIGLSLHSTMFREFGLGCLLGFLMMSGIFVVELMIGYVHIVWRGYAFLKCLQVIGSSLIFFAVAAMMEEVFFRGYLFQTLIQWITFLPATLLLALAFAFSHAANPNIATLSLVNIGLAGVWLSVAYMKTRSLYLPFGLHLAWNFSQTTLYAFPTSGGSLESQRLWDLFQTGPEWVTGGAFGPEGGILATLALLISTWYILKSAYLQAPEGIVTLDSVEDLLPNLKVTSDQSV